jgi:hypothetical protein
LVFVGDQIVRMKQGSAFAARRPLAGGVALALALLGIAAGAARAAETEADFYRGKTITLIIGAAAGAAYDLVGRAVAAHLRQHIPGEPAIVVQNMPGAASLVMVNHLYNRAPKDGTVFGLPLNGILLEPRLNLYSGNGASVNFDLGRMGWIGSPSQQPQVLWVRQATPFKSFKDIQAGKVTFGATSPSADNYILPQPAIGDQDRDRHRLSGGERYLPGRRTRRDPGQHDAVLDHHDRSAGRIGAG